MIRRKFGIQIKIDEFFAGSPIAFKAVYENSVYSRVYKLLANSNQLFKMTLPAKNSKRLRLDSGSFRYVFKADKRTNRGRLLVEPEFESSILVVNWTGLLLDKPDVLPRRFIKAAIEYAIQKGWPEQQLEFAVRRDGDNLSFVDRPANAPNNWTLEVEWPLKVDGGEDAGENPPTDCPPSDV